MPEQFKVGDVVQIKSGGPPMTVLENSLSDRILCGWFDAQGKWCSLMFHPECLALLPEKETDAHA